MINLKTAPDAVLLLRVAAGLLFLAHGLLKALVFTIPRTVGYFESMGFPGYFAYLTIIAELFGGLALIAGLKTFWGAVALLPVMLGATFVLSGTGWNLANGGGWEFPAFWAVTLVTIALLGNRTFALKLLTSLGVARPAQTQPAAEAPLTRCFRCLPDTRSQS
ncbi:MAG: DoxX family protein [Pseudomonadota bacterium]